ncbi:MAG: hypothetical protein AB7F86_16960 [Bdellovibrionales bacterium]
MRTLPIIGTAAVLGGTGLIYEFVFATYMASVFGQAALQFSITIGTFLLGLGAGSWVSDFFPRPIRQLAIVQVALTVVAPLGFTLLVASQSQWVGLASVFLIGALTGTELPVLIRSSATSNQPWVISADHFGMMAAAFAFPLFLLPSLGLVTPLIGAALLNLFVGVYLLWRPR